MSTDNTISDNYAPNWLPFISPEGDILADILFAVDCQICRKRLAISEPPDAEEVESFAVLPCGHAFGCERHWINGSDDPTCPSCRFSLRHSRCEHKFVPRPIELNNSTNMYDAISQSIVGELPPLCRDCLSGRHRPRGRASGDRTSHSRSTRPRGYEESYDNYGSGPDFSSPQYSRGHGRYRDRVADSPPVSPTSRHFSRRMPVPSHDGRYGTLYGPSSRSVSYSAMPYSGRRDVSSATPSSYRHHGHRHHHNNGPLDDGAIQEMVEEELAERVEAMNLSAEQRAAAVDYLTGQVRRRMREGDSGY
jgi:hypothetical protein